MAEQDVISFPQIEEKPTAGRSLAEGGVIQLPPMVEVKTQRERRLETSQAYIFETDKGGKR